MHSLKEYMLSQIVKILIILCVVCGFITVALYTEILPYTAFAGHSSTHDYDSSRDPSYGVPCPNTTQSLGGGSGSSSGPSLDATLRVRNISTGASETTSNIIIGLTEEISLRWSSWDDPATCTASANNGGDTQFSTGGLSDGTDLTITEPNPGSSRTYTVSCVSNRGVTANDSITVKRKPNIPVTTLHVKNRTAGTPTTTADISIITGEQISLRWGATNSPTSCTASANTADAAFSTGLKTSGTDLTITEPTGGASRTYSVECINVSGRHTDSVVVSNPLASCTLDGVTVPSGQSALFYETDIVASAGMCSTISQSRTCTNGVLSGNTIYDESTCGVLPPAAVLSGITIVALPKYIRYGEDASITWNGGNADSCSVTGYGLNSSIKNGSQVVVSPSGQATYVISCVLGTQTMTSSTTINILPRYEDT